MRICFLAPANNYHTKKWCNYFASRGHDVHVISFIDERIDKVKVHFIDSGTSIQQTDIKKLKYLLKAGQIRKEIKKIEPDIINAHYATSYGTVAALSGLKNYILSVWGSDVYDFPQKSIFHRIMLCYSLHSAKYIFSTSKAMADETSKYTKKTIKITPFGVNTELFSPMKPKEKASEKFIIGTVKALTPKYGIDNLIRAVAMIIKERPDIPMQLRIAGKGPNEQEYKDLAKKLKIDDITTWLGFISQEEAAKEWANMDVAVVASESESFGVSAVEAESCGVPVVITDIPGLMEATSPGISSVVVPRGNVQALANAIIKLYDDPESRKKLGKAGRQFVIENYELNYCFGKIENLYKKIISCKK